MRLMTRAEALVIFDELPPISKIAYAVFCAKEVFRDAAWSRWADLWLSGKNRDPYWAGIEARNLYDRSNEDESLKSLLWSAWSAEDPSADYNVWARNAVFKSTCTTYCKVLLAHFVCPYCYRPPDQHTTSGQCLFNAHVWKDIDLAWHP